VASVEAWIVYSRNVLPDVDGKNMCAVLNRSTSYILKVWRAGFSLANQYAAAGNECTTELRKYVGASLVDYSGIVPISYDMYNQAPAEVIYGYAGTVGGTYGTLRRVSRSCRRPDLQNYSWTHLDMIVSLCTIFDAGYEDDEVQPLTLGFEEMACLWNANTITGLRTDFWMEFTKE